MHTAQILVAHTAHDMVRVLRSIIIALFYDAHVVRKSFSSSIDTLLNHSTLPGSPSD